MNRIVLLLALSLCSMNAVAGGAEEPPEPKVFERTVMAVPEPDVRIEAISGLVEIQGWSQISVYASGTLGQALEDPVVRRVAAGREISVLVQSENPGRTTGPGTDAQVKVLVPQDSRLIINTTTAEVRVSGVRGEVEVRSAKGDVIIEGPIEHTIVETFWGDITVVGPVSNSDLMTWEGDIVTTDLRGSAFLRAWNGDMHCTGAQVDQLDVFTESGSAHLAVDLGDSGNLQAVVNGQGDISIELPESTAGLFTFVGGPYSTLPEMDGFSPANPVIWTLGGPAQSADEGRGTSPPLQRARLRNFQIPYAYGITMTREFSVGEGKVRVIVQCSEIPEQARGPGNSEHRIVLRTTR